MFYWPIKSVSPCFHFLNCYSHLLLAFSVTGGISSILQKLVWDILFHFYQVSKQYVSFWYKIEAYFYLIFDSHCLVENLRFRREVSKIRNFTFTSSIGRFPNLQKNELESKSANSCFYHHEVKAHLFVLMSLHYVKFSV